MTQIPKQVCQLPTSANRDGFGDALSHVLNADVSSQETLLGDLDAMLRSTRSSHASAAQ